jgi:hypothetical protein
MQCTTRWANHQRRWGVAAHTIAVAGLVALMVLGVSLESSGGWAACRSLVVVGEGQRHRQRRRQRHDGFAERAGWAWLRRQWIVTAVRSEALMGLVFVTDCQAWEWMWVLPWAAWLWKGLGVTWPSLGRQRLHWGLGRLLEEASRLALVGLGCVWLVQHLFVLDEQRLCGFLVGQLGQWVEGSVPRIEVERDQAGMYHVRIRGEFEIHVDGSIEINKRMLVIWLGLLEVPGETRGSRRTRDGRTPFVRQEQMADWFGVPQPHISRWHKYWLEQDWRGMLSQRRGEVLTQEVQQGVVESWAKFPWWSAERLREHLKAQGSHITLRQVKQVAQESGWSVVHQSLQRVYQISADSFRVRDEWLVRQLLAQVQDLVAQLEGLGELHAEQQLALADLEAQCAELGLRPADPFRPLSWVLQMEHWLFGHWELVEDRKVRCIYCGTTQVSRKSG